MIDLSNARWKKASYSASGNGGCVEIARNLPGVAAVRDSKNPGGGAHVVRRSTLDAFLVDVKAGRFDL